MKILILSTGKPGNVNWMHNHRPIRTALISQLGQDGGTDELMKIVNDLPIQLPKKGPKIEELFLIKEIFVNQRKPNVPSRIGVGYKDKGGLGGGSEDPLAVSDFLDREEVFDFLLRQAKNQLFGTQRVSSELKKFM
jgi:hypothetical protein